MMSRRVLEESLMISIPTLLAALISYLIGIYPHLSLPITEALLVTTIVLSALVGLYNPATRRLWSFRMKSRLNQPLIGILEQNECRPMYTSFTPQDWKGKLSEYEIKSEFITVSEINSRFAAIVNPYGEVYPEEDMISLKSFETIKSYIKKGGIFLCAGGLAFFYGGDIHTPNRTVPLDEEVLVYLHLPNMPSGSLSPQHKYPPRYSLHGTLLKREFGVVTTWIDTERSQCFQEGEDKRFVGDIRNAGDLNEILHFRAVREPIRRCKPFLRIRSSNWRGDAYAIAGIPYGKGCLLLNGFDLRDNTVTGSEQHPVNAQWDRTIHYANFEKICVALKNLLENRRNGGISLSAEDW